MTIHDTRGEGWREKLSEAVTASQHGDEIWVESQVAVHLANRWLHGYDKTVNVRVKRGVNVFPAGMTNERQAAVLDQVRNHCRREMISEDQGPLTLEDDSEVSHADYVYAMRLIFERLDGWP